MDIPEWYKGKTLFVTGGSGFMGKVLLEKLLRSCPEIDRIYVLLRPKKGICPQGRLDELSKSQVFNRLTKENPKALSKLFAIEGDLSKDDLGISDQDRTILENDVNVLFNVGADVRLETGLKCAIKNNTVSTLRVLELAVKMKNLQAFLFVSTAFCHCGVDVLEEKVYLTVNNAKEMIEKIMNMTEEEAEMEFSKIRKVNPNSYTYSKLLAETLVDEFSDHLPVAIVRPSIVIPSVREPMPGWVDSFYGPMGLLIAASKGLMVSMLANPDIIFEGVPVDIAINGFIAAAWYRGANELPSGEVPVFNLTVGEASGMTYGYMMNKVREYYYEFPAKAGLWYPRGGITINPYKHALFVLLFQTLPAYFVDLLLRLLGKEAFLVKLQKKIAAGAKVMKYFSTREFKFKTDKVSELSATMNEKDRKRFYLYDPIVGTNEYALHCVLGGRMYLLKEPLDTLPKARIQLKLMFCLDVAVQILFFAFLFWISTKCLGPLQYLVFGAN